MKVDFGDLYKFIVSAGLALAGGALLSVWLVFREPFDLRLTEVEIHALTPLAQTTIHERQEFAGMMVKYVPIGATLALLAGLALAAYGFRQWKKLQAISDQLAQLNLQEKNLQVRPKTEDEQAAAGSPGAVDAPVVHIGSTTRSPVAFERSLINRLTNLVRPGYAVQRDMMIGDRGVDLLLTGSGLIDKDILLETKYISKGFNQDWLKQVALGLRAAALVYQQAQGRIPNTVLLVAVEDEVFGKKDYGNIVNTVNETLGGKPSRHRIVVMPAAKMLQLPDAELATLAGVPYKGD